MGFIGVVQVEDGKNRTGSGMVVHEDGSVDANVVNADPIPVEVTNTPTVAVVGTVPVSLSSCICAIKSAGSVVSATFTASSSSTKMRDAETRYGLTVKNTHSSSSVFIRFGSSAATLADFPIGPGETFSFPAGLSSNDEIRVIGQSGGEELRLLVYL